jgi:hypothetical protein
VVSIITFVSISLVGRIRTVVKRPTRPDLCVAHIAIPDPRETIPPLQSNKRHSLDNVAVLLKTKEQLQILPSISSTTINAFLIFILVQWWSATILDYPDMNGQKLMASKSIKDISKSVFFPSFLMIFFRILFFTLPFIAVYFDFTNGFTDGELAFTSLFINTLPKWMLIFVILLFFIPFLSIVQNTQNWGGSFS